LSFIRSEAASSVTRRPDCAAGETPAPQGRRQKRFGQHECRAFTAQRSSTGDRHTIGPVGVDQPACVAADLVQVDVVRTFQDGSGLEMQFDVVAQLQWPGDEPPGRDNYSSSARLAARVDGVLNLACAERLAVGPGAEVDD